MKIVGKIIATMVIEFIIFLLFGFMAGALNPFEWHWVVRVIYVIWLAVSVGKSLRDA